MSADNSQKIRIKKTPAADSRTCDVSKVSKSDVLDASRQHIVDVAKVLGFLSNKLLLAAVEHDYDKLTDIDGLYRDFQQGFQPGWTTWWDNHRKIHRHHLDRADGIPKDVNLLDVLEFSADCIAAGMARKGEIYPVVLSDELLRTAFENTNKLIHSAIEVVD
jgi:hypothetical protein